MTKVNHNIESRRRSLVGNNDNHSVQKQCVDGVFVWQVWFLHIFPGTGYVSARIRVRADAAPLGPLLR